MMRIISILLLLYCIVVNGQNDSEIFYFIGRKIKIEEFDPNAKKSYMQFGDLPTDSIEIYIPAAGYRCNYKIIENLTLKKDGEITFRFIGEFKPRFIPHENALFFVKKHRNNSYDYENYAPTFFLKNKWYGVFNFSRITDLKDVKKYKTKSFNSNNLIKYPIDSTCDSKCQKRTYPSKYFLLKDGYVYPKKVWRIDDIIEYEILKYNE